PGFDRVAQGMSGLMSVTGLPGQGPVRTGAAIADMAAGLFAALGVMTALLEREASGRGQWVQSSLLQAGIALLDFQAARYLMKGEVPPQVGNDHPTSMPTSAYKTADGYINVAASGEGMWKSLCNVIGREDLIARDEFKDNERRATHRASLNAILNESFATRASEEWVAELNRSGVPCGPIYRVDQVFADPQVRVVVLAGAGDKAFVSGADISQFENQRSSKEAVQRYEEIAEAAQARLHTLDKPVLAMIRGYCLGAGVNIANVCDLRIAGDDARFGIPAAKMGLGYRASPMKNLVDTVGAPYAREIMITGRQFTAQEAKDMGLVHHV